MNSTKIIIEAVKDRLEQFDENYTELLMEFKPEEKTCSAVLIDDNNQREKFPLDDSEVSKLKNLFLNKIAKAYKIETKDTRKVCKIILKITLIEETFKLFIEVENSNELFQLY